MASLNDFARGFFAGSVQMDGPPKLTADVLPSLHERWRVHALSLPGVPLPLHEPTALRAIETAAWACWFLVSLDDEPAEVAKRLDTMTEGDPASADLVLSRLPIILRRARSLGVRDPLAVELEKLLRRWPLSGVLADIGEPPTGAVDFGHDGLRLLYAERLAERPKTAWIVPRPVRPFIDLVFGQRGLPIPQGDGPS